MRRSMLILSEHRQPKDLSSLLPTRFTQLLFRHRSVRVSPLDATLMDLPTSVANKRLTVGLNPLDATLTKNTGVPPPRQTFFSLLPLPPVRRFRLSDATSLWALIPLPLVGRSLRTGLDVFFSTSHSIFNSRLSTSSA